jgi:hypothetical protein
MLAMPILSYSSKRKEIQGKNGYFLERTRYREDHMLIMQRCAMQEIIQTLKKIDTH